MSEFSTVNPATDQKLSTYCHADWETASDVIGKSHAAFLKWREKSHQQRASYLLDIAKALRENADSLAMLMTQETGKLLKDGKTEVELCAQIFEYTAEHGAEVLADEKRSYSGGDKSAVLTYCPIGVVYSIQPWNFRV